MLKDRGPAPPRKLGLRICADGIGRRSIDTNVPPGGRSFFPRLETAKVRYGLQRHIMAAGGAGSSGLPALASGRRTNKTPNATITAKPNKYDGSAKITGSGQSK